MRRTRASHSYHELTPPAEVETWARKNPSVPRVCGIDVGQANLAIWFGAPNPDALADNAGNMQFRYFGWVLISCGATKTNDAACKLVTDALNLYADNPFGLASDIVIEKQHKKNGRMKAIARAIHAWIRQRVPDSSLMRVVERHARCKFATIVQLPCPMPREYAQRKQASKRAIGTQVRDHAGKRWFDFFARHDESGDDLADAALTAQDYAISTYLLTLVQTHALRDVSAVLRRRQDRNTWRRGRKGGARADHEFERGFCREATGYAAGASDDDNDEHAKRRSAAAFKQSSAKRARANDAADDGDFIGPDVAELLASGPYSKLR